MRHRLRILLTCGLLVMLIAAAFPAATSARGPVRNQAFSIVTSNQVPYLNINVSGVLSGTFSGTEDSFTIDWTFRGSSTGGGPATASGTGVGSWTPSSHALTLTLTGINSWDVPGFPQPKLSSATVIRLGPTIVSASVGDMVTGIPLAVAPAFGNPFTQPFQTWKVSSIGTGAINLNALPGAQVAAAGQQSGNQGH